MKTTVKHVNDTKVELTISVTPDELAAAKQVALKKLARDMKVSGFRKGKVPANVAAKNIDPNVLSQQTLEDALSKAVADAFIRENIQALERPAVEIKKYVPEQELEFTAESEILPKVTLGSYKNLKAKKVSTKVEQSDIEDVISRMRTSFATKEEVDRQAKVSDEVIIDFVGKKDGVAFDGGTGIDYALTLGSNQFIPGFEEGIVGKKIGETFDLELTFPKEYHVADLKGAKTVFTTTLKKVSEVKLPDLDDEFAAKVGPFTNMDGVRDDIKNELIAQKERKANEELKDELVQGLIDASNVPVPEILLNDQMRSIEQDMAQNLMYQGLTLDQYLENKGFESKEKWLGSEVRDAAEKRVKAGLALAEMSKIEKIEATTAELEEHIALYKQQYGKDAEAIKQLDTPDARRDIANRLLTEKTVQRLVDLNTKK